MIKRTIKPYTGESVSHLRTHSLSQSKGQHKKISSFKKLFHSEQAPHHDSSDATRTSSSLVTGLQNCVFIRAVLVRIFHKI